MAANLLATSKKLVKALNTRGYMLTFSYKQFMSKDGKPINYYSINKATWNEERGRYHHTELYSTSSMVRLVLYLRDMWYKENGWELPTDQELWNKLRLEQEAKENG